MGAPIPVKRQWRQWGQRKSIFYDNDAAAIAAEDLIRQCRKETGRCRGGGRQRLTKPHQAGRVDSSEGACPAEQLTAKSNQSNSTTEIELAGKFNFKQVRFQSKFNFSILRGSYWRNKPDSYLISSRQSGVYTSLPPSSTGLICPPVHYLKLMIIIRSSPPGHPGRSTHGENSGARSKWIKMDQNIGHC